MCKEKEKLQKKAYELKRRLLLCQKKKELEDFLDAQVRGKGRMQRAQGLDRVQLGLDLLG